MLKLSWNGDQCQALAAGLCAQRCRRLLLRGGAVQLEGPRVPRGWKQLTPRLLSGTFRNFQGLSGAFRGFQRLKLKYDKLLSNVAFKVSSCGTTLWTSVTSTPRRPLAGGGAVQVDPRLTLLGFNA